MSEEIASADANLAELARLRTELHNMRLIVEQRDRALEAERRARANAEADAAALIAAINRYAAAPPDERGAAYHRLFVTVVADHPGQALLAELDAARAVVEAAKDWREAVETLDGVYAAEQALLAALKAAP